MKKGCLNKDRIEEFAENSTPEEFKNHYLYGCLKCIGYEYCIDYIESNKDKRRTLQEKVKYEGLK